MNEKNPFESRVMQPSAARGFGTLILLLVILLLVASALMGAGLGYYTIWWGFLIVVVVVAVGVFGWIGLVLSF